MRSPFLVSEQKSLSQSSSVDVAGWKLTDDGAKHSYTFAGTTVPAAGTVTITSGTATGDLKWISTNVWNNDGDTAFLYGGSGQLVSRREDDRESDSGQI